MIMNLNENRGVFYKKKQTNKQTKNKKKMKNELNELNVEKML